MNTEHVLCAVKGTFTVHYTECVALSRGACEGTFQCPTDPPDVTNVSLQVCVGQSPEPLRIFTGGSVAEWLVCLTQAQKGPGSNRSRDAVG